MSIVNPALAAFTSELAVEFDRLLEKHALSAFFPIGLELTTVDGLTARFYEEGIEFYPEARA